MRLCSQDRGDADTIEIDERRRSLLALQGFSPTAFDAERPDNLPPPDKVYTGS